MSCGDMDAALSWNPEKPLLLESWRHAFLPNLHAQAANQLHPAFLCRSILSLDPGHPREAGNAHKWEASESGPGYALPSLEARFWAQPLQAKCHSSASVHA